MTDALLLIGDVGGTNARFALAQSGQGGYEQEQVLSCDDFDSPEQAIAHYLGGIGVSSPEVICLAVAGPVANGSASLTNHRWQFSEKQLSDYHSRATVRLVNDFEATALGLVDLGPAEIAAIGSASPPRVKQRDFVVAVMGPGTGLGAATLVKRQDKLIPLSCEAGHVGFAPNNDLQAAVLRELAIGFGRVSNERLASGMGLPNLYNAVAKINGIEAQKLNAAEIFAAIGQDSIAAASVDLFFELLGQVAGDFVLATGAFDGLFISGGIALRYPELLKKSAFRAGFENKGRHRSLMETVPTALVCHPYPGLLGAASLAQSLLTTSG